MNGDNQEAAEPVNVVGLRGDDHHLRADMKMLARAIKNKWIIPSDAFKDVPEEMLALLKTSKIERNRIGAAQVLVTMNGQNAKEDASEEKALTVNVGVQVAHNEDARLTDEELDEAIDGRLAVLASIEAKGISTDA